jgi:protein-disulfide isomerase
MEEKKVKKDYLLPASILFAAILISVSLIYNAGQKVKLEKESDYQEPKINNPEAVLENVIPPTDKDRIKGNLSAPIKIITYSDLECPFCKRFHYTLKNTKSIYGDQVALIFRHFPLTQLHSKAIKEAQGAECAYKLGGNDAFWNFIDNVFEVTPSNNNLDLNELPKIAKKIGLNNSEFQSCLDSDYGKDIIQSHYENAVNSGAQGTPYTIVINSKGKKYVIPGAYPLEEVKKIIDQAIKEG